MLSVTEKNTPEIVTKPACVEGTFAGPVVLGTGLQAVGAGVGVGVKTQHIGVNGPRNSARVQRRVAKPFSMKKVRVSPLFGQGKPTHPLHTKQPAV